MKQHNPTADPLWYKDAIIYQLHVKAFFDSNEDGIGDFPGLIQSLDYLQDVGITCIWLLPFYPSPLRDDGYDISDYHGVHPAYGTVRDFRKFVREAHRRGIRVITELVINHTSDQHPWFQAARTASPGSSKRNYYVWSDTDQKYSQARIIFTDSEKSNWTWDPEAHAYYWHRFFYHQPDLNFDHPRVRRAVLKIMRYWLDMDVDGLRLDAVPYLIERDGTNCENLPETHALLKGIRSHLEAHYRDRMLLAEANQWPSDVRPYFGDGDECHMAFHFPLMPRIFMALRQEDRHPIVEIMQQTPDIPGNCQWALFLRNHDELTLEMVTDDERDYMYQEYAADSQMRLNLGIRRRLAPLVGNSRRRMELLTSLLFSFPGTPVIYYGDEIGMGDNIYLGDRNGVRTPMQWTADRNAGFSRVDFARLYSPPVMDPVYGYQAVNVEGQQREPSSLLNWMKRLIALRKRTKMFGRGTLEFLQPENRKLLAYVRRYQEEIFLGVANLSRFVQPAELDLSQFKGLTPVEMFGRVEFPPIGDLPYFLTLGPHSFYWFTLEQAPQSIAVRPVPQPAEERAAVPTLRVSGGWDTLLEDRACSELERTVLPQFLRRQRWFGAKARAVQSTHILDWVGLTGAPCSTFLVLIEVRYGDGGSDTYFVPLGVAAGPGAEKLLETRPQAALVRLKGPAGEGLLHDALADDGACRALLSAIEQRREFPATHGTIKGIPSAVLADMQKRRDTPLEITRGLAEQSNSAILYGDQFILKVFRRIEPGVNPDYEIGRFLTEKTNFDRIPKTAGAIEYQGSDHEPTTVAILQELVPNQGTGWERALQELSHYFERAYSQTYEYEQLETKSLPPMELIEAEAPAAAAELIGSSLPVAATVGKRTAELHLALATTTENSAFLQESLTAADLEAAACGMQKEAQNVFALLAQQLDRLSPPIVPQARRVLREAPRLVDRFAELSQRKITATKIRCHGDYHLGQILCVENDFVIIDFEGEPARSISERRAKQSPLKDVAGILRSLDYAAYAGLLTFTQDRPQDFGRLLHWADVWRTWTSAAFLRDYCATAAGATFLPANREHFTTLLQFFVFDKAMYELGYELNHRPDWVSIPLLGISELIETVV